LQVGSIIRTSNEGVGLTGAGEKKTNWTSPRPTLLLFLALQPSPGADNTIVERARKPSQSGVHVCCAASSLLFFFLRSGPPLPEPPQDLKKGRKKKASLRRDAVALLPDDVTVPPAPGTQRPSRPGSTDHTVGSPLR